MSIRRNLLPAIVIACTYLSTSAAHAVDAVVAPLMTKALPELPGKEVTLMPGQTFYEGPNDVHLVGKNASSTQPAKFVVVLIKKQGAPILTVE